MYIDFILSNHWSFVSISFFNFTYIIITLLLLIFWPQFWSSYVGVFVPYSSILIYSLIFLLSSFSSHSLLSFLHILHITDYNHGDCVLILLTSIHSSIECICVDTIIPYQFSFILFFWIWLLIPILWSQFVMVSLIHAPSCIVCLIFWNGCCSFESQSSLSLSLIL